MRYLHTMVRVADLDKSLAFYCEHLGLEEIRRIENKGGRFTLVFLAAPGDAERAKADQAPMVELTYNWDPEDYKGGRNFGHLAYRVDDIYATCRRLMDGGVIINRPSRKAPWLLLALAQASFAAGQVSFLLAQEIGTKLPFPSFADLLYLLTYPLYAAGLLIFIRWRTPDRDRRSLIDALTLTAGLALLSWIYLVLPYVHDPGLTWLQKSVAIAYPLGDVLVLAMMSRLLASGSARARSLQLLALGSVGMLVSDVSYGLLQLHGTFHTGTIVDLGWAIFYSAWGAAALHPS